MEKNDIRNIFKYFYNDLKDDNWSRFFYLSLCNNIWYHTEHGILYDYVTQKELERYICEYRNKNFFREEDFRDYYTFHYKQHTQKFKSAGDVFGYVSSYIKETDGYKRFIVLENNEENLSYIKSLLRDKKIEEIIK